MPLGLPGCQVQNDAVLLGLFKINMIYSIWDLNLGPCIWRRLLSNHKLHLKSHTVLSSMYYTGLKPSQAHWKYVLVAKCPVNGTETHILYVTVATFLCCFRLVLQSFRIKMSEGVAKRLSCFIMLQYDIITTPNQSLNLSNSVNESKSYIKTHSLMQPCYFWAGLRNHSFTGFVLCFTSQGWRHIARATSWVRKLIHMKL